MRFTTIAHRDHEIMSPLAPATVDALVEALALRKGATVLDVGCGNGAMLLRLLEHARKRVQSTVGIDRNPAMIEMATARTGDLPEHLRERVSWRCGEGRDVLDEEHRYNALLCVGATGAFGGFGHTLAALPKLLVPGGRALIGEGYWRREPAPEYLEALGATRDEMTGFEETIARAQAAGFKVTSAIESTTAEWEKYESLYANAIERWCEENAHDEEAEAFRQRIARWREAYERWGRNTLGFVALVVATQRVAA